MNIRFMGAHNCESLNTRLICLVIDGVLALDCGGLSSTLSLPDQQHLQGILITHQHYDHIRDIPAIAMNCFLRGGSINVYSPQAVYDTVVAYLLNGRIYPKFTEFPEARPAVNFTVIKPNLTEHIAGYEVIAVPVNHSEAAVGYQVTSAGGKAVFYTGDTGPGLSGCWESVSPGLLVIEVTAPNRYEEWAAKSMHLTPSLLGHELVSFRELKGYLPPVVVGHINPGLEEEIAAEIRVLASELHNPVTLAYEGMELEL